MGKDLLLKYLYISYLDARKHKRHTHSQMIFESNLGENLINLCDDIYNERYVISPSIYFIQKKPIQREVFAGNFRDRIAHHLVYNIIAPYREKQFIYDSYSCRKGKGTSKGIERISKFMRSCSDNYKHEGRILKLDIQGYFMSINRDILREKNEKVLNLWNNFSLNDKGLPRFLISGNFPNYLKKVIHDIIFNDPTTNGIFKGCYSDYEGLPKSKSLFYSMNGCGLPIGNLTSQLFSNVYLNDFDHYIKNELKIRYYGRYVDDFIIIHRDKEYLKSLIPLIKEYLKSQLKLTVHPKKIYIQRINHGVQFLGAIIKPYRIYRAKRSITNFRKKLIECNYSPSESSLNSYLGLFIKYKQYHVIQKIMKNVKYNKMNKISHLIKYYQDSSF